MAVGLTLKQDRFAHEYVANGGNASAAYRATYDVSGNTDTINREAHALVTHPKIAPRVDVIRRDALAYAGITSEAIAAEFNYNHQRADALGQAGAMNSATRAKADLKGLFPNPSLDIRSVSITAELEGLTIAELRAMVDKLETPALTDDAAPQNVGADG